MMEEADEHTIPDWEAKYAAILGTADLVAERLPLLTTKAGHFMGRQVAAAYLARCRRLLLAMDHLRLAGMNDTMGSPAP